MDVDEEASSDSVELQLEAVHMSYGQQRHSIPIPAQDVLLETAEDPRPLCDRFGQGHGELRRGPPLPRPAWRW